MGLHLPPARSVSSPGKPVKTATCCITYPPCLHRTNIYLYLYIFTYTYRHAVPSAHLGSRAYSFLFNGISDRAPPRHGIYLSGRAFVFESFQGRGHARTHARTLVRSLARSPRNWTEGERVGTKFSIGENLITVCRVLLAGIPGGMIYENAVGVPAAFFFRREPSPCGERSRRGTRVARTRSATDQQTESRPRGVRFASGTCNFEHFRPFFQSSEFLGGTIAGSPLCPLSPVRRAPSLTARTLHLLPARRKKCRRRLSE